MFDAALFLCALGLALVLESSLYALFPEGMRRLLTSMMSTSPAILRRGGLCGLAIGVLLLWIGRSLT